MDTALSFYCPLVKMDPAKRLVYGYASTEALDTQGEIVSREALARALPEYMRFGNVREMHQLSAVGKAKQAELDEKGLYVVAKIVDEAAWTKVKEGVYAGFSIGGKKITKQDQTITALSLTEISLVDRPANPECVIELVKVAEAIGKVEAREDVSQADKQRAESQYGDVEYADAKNKKYPIDTEDHIRAAWNYISKEKNAQKYSAEDLQTIKGRIVDAWKKKIDKEGPPAAQEGKVAKGMYGVAQLAALVDALDQFRCQVQLEAEMEGDGSSVPGQVAACLADLCACLRDYVAEETAELAGDEGGIVPGASTEVMTMIAKAASWPPHAPLRKAGARHSKEDQARVDAIHQHAGAIAQHAQDLGSQYVAGGQGQEEEMDDGEKVAKLQTVALQAQDMAKEIAATLTKVQAENETLRTRVAELEAQPAAPKGALKVVAKGEDLSVAEPSEPEPKTALDAIKKAHRNPFTIGAR